MDIGEKTYAKMKQMIEKDHESLLMDLKENARYVEIHKRKEFESHLLQLAQETADYSKRNSIYEVLVSLQAIWNQNQPGKGLQKKFRAAFEEGNYKEAEECYKKLAKQGLDYIEGFQAGEGEIIPISTNDKDMLLQYSRKALILYTLQFEELKQFLIPGTLGIIDVHVPSEYQLTDCMETEADKTFHSTRKIGILMEDKNGKKAIASIDIENIDIITQQFHGLEKQVTHLDETLKEVCHLSCFQNHALLVSKKSIYYCDENKEWKEWYTTKNEITAFESTIDGFWVGHSNGDVIILKNPKFVGVRVAFKGISTPIKSIRATGRFAIISSRDSLKFSDYTGNPVFKPLDARCEIMQATTLNDEFLLLHLANGMLVARDLKQGNTLWQMDLGNSYEFLFVLRQYVFCGKKDGTIMLLEIPPFEPMAKELESKNIRVEDLSFNLDPNAPVRYITDFTGRQEILNEIKVSYDAHFLIYGEPRIGKTSLLNVLRDVMSEKARCCVVDMEQLLKETDSYEAFELKFMEKCLGQHFMKISELPEIGGYSYQTLRSMVTKIKGAKHFCIFGMDNFFIPTYFDQGNKEKFNFFLRSMLLHPEVRLIITCSSMKKNDIVKNIENLDIFSQRKFVIRKIPLFSEGEVKNTLRKRISLHQPVVDNIYKYTGRFPHLIHLYDRWKPGHLSIDQHSEFIARIFSGKIFEYFRDLSLDARLSFATCLHENLVGEKISYTRFYEHFPSLKNILPKDRMDTVLKEINGYGSGLSTEQEAEAFQITISDNVRLFYEASRHISWIKNFKTLYEFTSASGQENAHNMAHSFAKITQCTLELDEKNIEQKTGKYKDIFYTNKLTEQGLMSLKMPLDTFIVLSLTPWRKETHIEAFNDLCIEFQEFNRKTGESRIFYILLFVLHDIPKGEVKRDLTGLDRISIIDASMMKDIILAESPKDKATDYIFDQLSIRERSPYTTAGAVPDNLFFGRQMELALIRGLPENMGIFGTRTIGKTSLLRRLHKTFKAQKGWKVYDLDCARIESEESLLKNLSEKMDIAYEEISNLDKFRKYVTREAENGGYRYLFLLDEVDRLVEYDIQNDEKIFNTFNRLCNETMKNNESAARFILFGFHQMFEQMKNPQSRLYNFMVFLPLQALDIDGAMNLVTGPIENIRVRWKDEEDAKYLVDNCSRHPRLLQSACNALLTNLDDKMGNRDIIDRNDVDKALSSPEFREICMRFYYDVSEEKENDDYGGKKKKVGKNKAFISRILRKDTPQTHNQDTGEMMQKISAPPKKEFLNDLHRITILTAIRILFEEEKEIFTMTDIFGELKNYNIDVTPNQMRNILDQLCLNGNFRLRDESTIIAKEGTKIQQQADQIDIDKNDLTVGHPDDYVGNDATFPRFTFEFGVKIFPKLLVAHFGGLKQCEEERKRLVEKGAWKEWLRRY